MWNERDGGLSLYSRQKQVAEGGGEEPRSTAHHTVRIDCSEKHVSLMFCSVCLLIAEGEAVQSLVLFIESQNHKYLGTGKYHSHHFAQLTVL